MKKYYILGLIMALIGISCAHEDEEFKYDSNDNIYFGISDLIGLNEEQAKGLYPEGIKDPKATVYSFAIHQKGMDTVLLPVSVSGKRVNYERKFTVRVVADSTTAESSLHYEPLADFYTIPADSGATYLPLVLYNKDPELELATFYIRLELVPTEDFAVSIPEYNYAKISFSNRLERPNWWTNWQGELGGYSRTKHALYLIALDGIEDKDLIPDFNGDNSLLIPYNLFLVAKFEGFLIDPFGWVNDHPEYILSEQEAGVYHFYNSNNTFKVYELVLNSQDGKYYFIDENGKQVSTDF